MHRLKATLPYILAAIGFAGIALLLTNAYQTLEFDTDEGINLMKALLYSEGFSLYTEIWNDQPPLFTVLLSLWFSLVGSSVIGGRWLVLLFSIALLWSFYQVIVMTLGRIPALISASLLIASWTYIRLSVSVMIGLPSLAVAMLAIYCLMLYKKKRSKPYLIASGILLALSLQIKLITVFFIPIFIFCILKLEFFDRQFKPTVKSSHVIKAVLIWFLVVVITYGLTSFFLNSFHPDQLIQIHFSERTKVATQNYADFHYLLTLLRQDPTYLWLGTLGVLTIIATRKWDGVLPISWFAIAFLLLATHNPVWYHHYLLLSVPIAWLSAYGIAIAIHFIKQKPWRSNRSIIQVGKLLFSGAIAGLIVLAMVGTPERLSRPINDVPVYDQRVVDLVMQYREQTHWILTDRPVYAFDVGLPVPPEVAVMSRKRFNSGLLTFDDLLTVLRTYQPEQIILAKYINAIKSYEPLRKYINQNYVKTYRNKDNQIEHYLSKQIAPVESSSLKRPDV